MTEHERAKDEALELTAREFCDRANMSPHGWRIHLEWLERVYARFARAEKVLGKKETEA